MPEMKFKGFSPEALKFLKQLKKNNERDWFQPRKEKYDQILKQPFSDLIHDMAILAEKEKLRYYFDPKRCLLRIYRDTRFSKDKTPYKTYIAGSFARTGIKKSVDRPGMYFQIEPNNTFVGGGLYIPDSQQIRKIREMVQKDHETLEEILNHKDFKKLYGNKLPGEKLKTHPRGYTPEHPQIEYLKLKEWYVGSKIDDKDILSPKLPHQLIKLFKVAEPFNQWIEAALRLW